jgi:4-diphosphocytidyl-2-C-methyl-D-erythritol kinase
MSTHSKRYFSPAKINLFLSITEKRPDGFHNLASLFQAVSLGDWLTFTPSQEDQVECNEPSIPLDENNLVCQALTVFRKKTGNKQPFHIKIEKNIPHQAGLGGANSNAATTLWALNELTKSQMTPFELFECSKELHSDTPFFFSQGTAFCQGTGEIVTEASLPKREVWIIKPKIGLSTPKVFSCTNSKDFTTLQKAEDSLKIWESGEVAAYNDLERPAFSLCSQLKDIKEEILSRGWDKVTMSGSGTSFYALGTPSSLENFPFDFWKCSFLRRDSQSWYEYS